MDASEMVWKSYCHKNDDTKITLIVLVQVKLIALMQLKKSYGKNQTLEMIPTI